MSKMNSARRNSKDVANRWWANPVLYLRIGKQLPTSLISQASRWLSWTKGSWHTYLPPSKTRKHSSSSKVKLPTHRITATLRQRIWTTHKTWSCKISRSQMKHTSGKSMTKPISWSDTSGQARWGRTSAKSQGTTSATWTNNARTARKPPHSSSLWSLVWNVTVILTILAKSRKNQS